MDKFKFGSEGTLYFMVEEDRFGGPPSSYVKIGIVSGDREVAKREREHQTGNPRKINSHHSIQTPGVQMLETFLHNYFAKYRVKGEWFLLGATDLDMVIDTAENRATEMGAYQLDLEFASEIGSLEVNQNWEANLDDPEGYGLEEIPDQVIRSHRELLSYRANREILSGALLSLRGAIEHPSEIFKVNRRAASETLSISKIRKLYPKLISEFEEVRRSWAYKLPFLDGRMPEEAKTGQIDLEAIEGDIFALHDAYLETWASIAKHQWDFQIAESQLLRLCGEAQSLNHKGELLVTWEEKSRVSFAKQDFEAKYPEEARMCYINAPAKETVAVAEWRAYSKYGN